MQNTRSRLEQRLARLLATAPPSAMAPTSADAAADEFRVDFGYLSEADQRRLDASIRH